MTHSSAVVLLDPGTLDVRVNWLRTARRFALAVCVALALDLAYVVAGAGIASFRLVRELDAASAALAEFDVATASVHSQRASRWGAFAASLGSRPSTRVLGAVPFVDGEIDGLTELTGAAIAVADESSALARDLSAASGGKLLDEIVAARGFDLDVLTEVADVVDEHAPLIRSRVRALADASSSSVAAGALGGGAARERAADAIRSVDQVQSALRVLPDTLGAGGSRHYLLVFRSPSEARGGGGLPGLVGVLGARQGRLSISRLESGRHLLRGVDVPDRLARGEIARTYGQSAVRDWRNVNQSPNFPATARVMLDLYRHRFGRRLDGVVSMDPLALGHLIPALGNVRGDGWRVVITRDNARRVLLHDVYRHFNGAEHLQNRYLASLVEAVWTKMFASATDHALLLRLLGETAEKQHLQVWMRDRDEQRLVSDIGAAGSSHHSPHTQVVFHNNWAGNKTDYFLRRTLDTSIRMQTRRLAVVTTRVVLVNDLPDSELERDPTVLTKPVFGRRRELGTNRMMLHFLLPREGRPRELRVDGVRSPLTLGRDGGRAVVSEFVELPPGARTDVVLRYVWRLEESGTVRFTMVPQATVRPDEYSVRLWDLDGKVALAEDGQTAGKLKTPASLVWRVD